VVLIGDYSALSVKWRLYLTGVVLLWSDWVRGTLGQARQAEAARQQPMGGGWPPSERPLGTHKLDPHLITRA
jgi:hypothetical protein